MAKVNRATRVCGRALVASVALAFFGCATPRHVAQVHPSVAPTTQPTVSLDVGPTELKPMYRELLAIDLPTVLRVANARNLDIEQARQRVEASKGRYESSVEAVFPVIAPSIAYQHLEGVNQNANGSLTAANFTNFLPAISVQWILNPGRVVYDIIASKRRMEASELQEHAVTLDTARLAAVQYYDLVLARARLAVARQSVAEAEELVRITKLKVDSGTGLPTDALRAQANLAGFQQDVFLALNQFYQASVALTLTLHLDPMVTLVPKDESIIQTSLVRDDMPIEELLTMAAQYRPDLQAVRTLLKSAEADTGTVMWGNLGPQLQAGYTYGGLQTSTSSKDYVLHEQQKAGVGASFALGLSTFGLVKTARANEQLASVDVQRQLDQVRAAVISAQQNSLTNAKLIPVASDQLKAAEEALRLAQANLKAGTMLTIDVLQVQAEVDRARLRYVDAVVHYNQAQVNFLAALGVLEPKAVALR
jgi:outer membrane protein TolC